MTSMPLELHRAEVLTADESKDDDFPAVKMAVIYWATILPLFHVFMYAYFHLDHLLGDGNW